MNLENKEKAQIKVIPIIDTIKAIKLSKVYDRNNRRFGQEFGILTGEKNTFRVFNNEIEDLSFLELIKDGSVLDRKYILMINKSIKGNHIISAKEALQRNKEKGMSLT